MVFTVLIRQFIDHPEVNFACTVRIIGFIILATSALCLASRTPLPPRKSGPVFEFEALKGNPYLFFIVDMLFNWWALTLPSIMGVANR